MEKLKRDEDEKKGKRESYVEKLEKGDSEEKKESIGRKLSGKAGKGMLLRRRKKERKRDRCLRGWEENAIKEKIGRKGDLCLRGL